MPLPRRSARVKLASLRQSAARLPFVGPVVRALGKSQRDGAMDMAASIAYFSFFSLFPLLMGLIAVSSFFIDSATIQSRVDRLLSDALPGSEAFVRANVEALVELRSAAGVASLVGLLWAGSKMFGALSRGINGALGLSRPHASFLSPLRYFLMTVVASIFLLASATVPTVLALLPQLDLGPLGEGLDNLATIGGSRMASYLFTVVMFTSLYRLVPFAKPAWQDVLPGSLVAAVLFECGKTVFLFYLNNVARLEAFYGSVSSVIALLIWLYLFARVVLFGSEIVAVCQEGRRTGGTTYGTKVQ